MIIDDGTGKGYKAQVDASNRLSVRSVAEPGSLEAAQISQFLI